MTKPLITLILYISLITCVAQAQTGTASYYTVESCKKEGTSGIMANGKELDDNAKTVASWDYKFGTVLLVKNLENGKTVRVMVSDRGPARRLYRMGRIVDLSRAAFSAIADPRKGVIRIEIKEL